jgi:3-hydroxymyristoyl/3-hydroxydecanoyl-(acyl carrier protein) dehydratase
MTLAHFAAFSFVDKITDLKPGKEIRGDFSIPDHVHGFPSALVGEAIGQLAAWAAMEVVDFSCRPVAALAGQISFMAAVRPGDVLELAADLESCDRDRVFYSGAAYVNGRPVMALHDCMAPMLPQEEFDDTDKIRGHYERLTTTGAEQGRLLRVPRLETSGTTGNPGHWREGELHVPSVADFFCDHFPRKPVLPATLLIDSLCRLTESLLLQPCATGQEEPVLAITALHQAKIRSWIAPGQCIRLRSELADPGSRRGSVKMSAFSGEEKVATVSASIAAMESRAEAIFS